MNNACRLWRLGPLPNRPLSHLIRPSSKEAPQLQALPHGQDDLRQCALGAELLALLSRIGLGFKGRKAFFKGDANGNYGVASCMLFDPFCDLGEVLVFLANVVFFAEVDEVDDGFCG